MPDKNGPGLSPVQALREIAFQLERAQAPTCRVRAFRRAAAAVQNLPPGELEHRLAPFRILTGIEVDILDDGGLDQSEELLHRLDVVVASVHSRLRLAVEAGCTFAIDTDAHAPGQLDWRDSGCARAEGAGITAGRVLNARSADEVAA